MTSHPMTTTSSRPATGPATLDVARAFLKKDMAEVWIGWVALLLLSGITLVSRLELSAAVDLFLMILVGRWILADPPAEPNALWRTLPVRPGVLFAVKLGAIALLIVLPILGLQALTAARIGVGGAPLALVVLETVIYAATLVIAASAVAVQSRDFPAFVIRGAAILIAIMLASAVMLQVISKFGGARLWFRPAWFETAMFLISLPFFAQAAWQGAARRGARVSLIYFAIGLGVVSVARPLVWATTVPDQAAFAPAANNDPGAEISLINLNAAQPGVETLRGWPHGVLAGIYDGGPSDLVIVALRGLAGALHLKNGRKIPVSNWLEHSGDNIHANFSGDGRSLRIVQLFDLQDEEIAKLQDATGQLDLKIQYQVGRWVVMPFDRTLRLVRAERQPGERLRVQIEQLAIPSQSKTLFPNFDLMLWNPDRSGGFRLRRSSGGKESPRIGVLTHPEMRTSVSTLDFELDGATRLPGGGEAADAARVITDAWLAHAKVEVLALLWDRERERRIVVPEFRIAEWGVKGE